MRVDADPALRLLWESVRLFLLYKVCTVGAMFVRARPAAPVVHYGRSAIGDLTLTCARSPTKEGQRRTGANWGVVYPRTEVDGGSA